MVIDSRSIGHGTFIISDVCVVGGGTAGISLARELAGAQFQVCLLEGGGLKPNRETQMLNWGENVGHPYYSLDTARPRYLGGSSNRWHLRIDDSCEAARMRPLDEIDFLERDWVPHSGWPFSKKDIDPYYERAQEVCRITPSTFEVKAWQNPSLAPILPFVNGTVETVIFKFGSRYPFINDYIEGLKHSENVSIYLNANVTEIETDGYGKTVTKLCIASKEGNKFWVRARLFVLCAGAIENARLLLASRSVQKNGLGNQHDLVGRFFMEHPHCSAGTFVPSKKAVKLPMNLYHSVHRVNGVPVIGKLSLSEETVRRERLLSQVVELYPKVVLASSLLKYPVINSRSVLALRGLLKTGNGAMRGAQLRDVAFGLDDVTTTLWRRMKSRLIGTVNRKRMLVYQLQSMSEQAPNPASRVLLSEERDSLGLPRVKLDWRLSMDDLHSITRTLELMDGAFRRAGLGHVLLQLYEEIPSPSITGGWHHMGTTRMHPESRCGVVDGNCKVHGLSNLFIAGPSVFPTGGYANPSLTIVALSIRLADYIKKNMKEM